MIFGDLIRRQDISGWLKAVWVIAVLMTSYLGILVYMITQGRGMSERNTQRAQAAHEDLRRVVGFSVADEIAKLEKLQQSGSITTAEFTRLRGRLVQANAVLPARPYHAQESVLHASGSFAQQHALEADNAHQCSRRRKTCWARRIGENRDGS
jgi:hypothetical protein